jgi:hypothetical protein
MVVGGLAHFVGHRRWPSSWPAEFGSVAWLLAFMFYYSIALGALFLVMVHHLTDAGWSVGIRRFCEHLASLLFPWLAILFVPVGLLGAKNLYLDDAEPGRMTALSAKWPVFTCRAFGHVGDFLRRLVAAVLAAALLVAPAGRNRRRRVHPPHAIPFGVGDPRLRGDADVRRRALDEGAPIPMVLAIYGVYFSPVALGRAGDGLCHHRDFAAAGHFDRVLKRQPVLFPRHAAVRVHAVLGLHRVRAILRRLERQHAGETFWYLIRENGNWWTLSMVLIFGHFLLPFFVLLPICVKSNFKIMFWVCAWAWAMNFADLAFNILPVLHPHGYPFKWLWLQLGCLAFMGGLLSRVFVKNFNAHAPFPIRDPRRLEAMGIKYETPEDIAATATDPGGHS